MAGLKENFMRYVFFGVMILGLMLVSVRSTAADKPAAKAKPAWPAWLNRFSVHADFRYRHELIKEADNTMRNRERIRLRVGAGFDVGAGFAIKIRLASGNADPVSTNQSLTEAFSSKPIVLDRAFARWDWRFLQGMWLMAGKTPLPFFRPGHSQLIFDDDLNPEGISLGFKRRFGNIQPFFSAAFLWAQEIAKAKDSFLLGIQAGVKVDILPKKLYLTIGGSYFDYTNTKGRAPYYEATKARGNSVFRDSKGNLSYMFDYNLIEAFLKIGGMIGRFPWDVHGDFVANLDPKTYRLGWLAGVTFGKTKKPLSFSIGYDYRSLQRDAVIGAFTFSDFAGGQTDASGHQFKLKFVPVRHVVLGITYLLNRRGVDIAGPKGALSHVYHTYHRMQADLLLKF